MAPGGRWLPKIDSGGPRRSDDREATPNGSLRGAPVGSRLGGSLWVVHCATLCPTRPSPLCCSEGQAGFVGTGGKCCHSPCPTPWEGLL